MAWKEVWRKEDEEARELLGRAGYGIVGRQKIRMTVEEEVSECCEKCMGRKLYIYQGVIEIGGAGSCHDALTCLGIPKFCPECGRKLGA